MLFGDAAANRAQYLEAVEEATKLPWHNLAGSLLGSSAASRDRYVSAIVCTCSWRSRLYHMHI